ncbi:hypothetical protein HHL19_16305 [Streptomyces sp. R302]|uniref:hypothetical protein n=1 Tax=unclassified Streptomyces TaxID=2593676 RepID=UPI00145F799F|nr:MULTISPECIES: hypothetical protein [unclassified Streptomyces]NML55333.1 hypothetical protein [Streptomyces sp. R301]NML80205.1 hypothetical protein [Streptomyces sp. R302]
MTEPINDHFTEAAIRCGAYLDADADAVLQVLGEPLPERKEFADPTTADDPTPLRWGLGDVLHGDDDSVTVCFSGPDREPYALHLDPARRDALRDDLTPPGDEQPEACRLVETSGTTVLVRGSGDWTDEDQGYMAEIVAAAKRKYEAEHPAVGQPAEAHGADRTAVLNEAIEAVLGRVEAYGGMGQDAVDRNRKRSAIVGMLRRMAVEGER